jgi:hypothetical protein
MEPAMPFPDMTDPPTELVVVGEHTEDPDQLLLQDTNGNYYAYAASEGAPHPVELDDTWTVEAPPDDELMP